MDNLLLQKKTNKIVLYIYNNNIPTWEHTRTLSQGKNVLLSYLVRIVCTWVDVHRNDYICQYMSF